VLSTFLSPATDTSATQDARLGSPEQFAAAFAVVARVLGTPSRVVVGYRVDPKLVRSGQPIPVVAKDIYAWAEVNINGIGWVPFDPTNTTPRKAQVTPPSQQSVSPPVSVAQAQAGPPAPAPKPHRAHHHSILPWLIVFVGLVVLLPLAMVFSKRLLRAFRKRNGEPAKRVVGAWLEARDQLRAHQVPATRSMTVQQVADGCITRDAKLAEQLAGFGRLVDGALYAPREPDEDAVAAAWELVDSVEATLRSGSSPPERIRAAIDPRPLAQNLRHRERTLV
jgi:hypothetical protein